MKKAPSAYFAGEAFFIDALGKGRTSNLRLRRPTLYPIELRELAVVQDTGMFVFQNRPSRSSTPRNAGGWQLK